MRFLKSDQKCTLIVMPDPPITKKKVDTMDTCAALPVVTFPYNIKLRISSSESHSIISRTLGRFFYKGGGTAIIKIAPYLGWSQGDEDVVGAAEAAEVKRPSGKVSGR